MDTNIQLLGLSISSCTESHETLYDKLEQGQTELPLYSTSNIAETQLPLIVSKNTEENSSCAQENNSPLPPKFRNTSSTLPSSEYVPDSSAATNPETCVVHLDASVPSTLSTSSYAGDIDAEESTRELCVLQDTTSEEGFLTQNSIDNTDSGRGVNYLSSETHCQGSNDPVVMKSESTLQITTDCHTLNDPQLEPDEDVIAYIETINKPYVPPSEESGFGTDTSGHYVTHASLNCYSTEI